MEGVAERLAEVRDRITRAGGDWRSVTVVAVSKGFGLDAIDAAYDAGLRDFGENYAQELSQKSGAGAASYPTPPRWHFLGPVQRNKVRHLAPVVHTWQGVDRIGEGVEIARHAPGAGVMVQVNVTGAPQRNGCSFEETPMLVEDLRRQELDVRGLMCIGPRHDPRTAFRRLATQARDLGLTELSMGMSADFEAAVQEGSTMVRVGSALFGSRPRRGTGDRLGRQGGF
ncbi:MAG: YggS family pyridoxal phosphate-dependent enzyme [Actinomycetota bacterium]|nr:YggS family pyridoxal phosphate-dependent enzyme [Actinomycetota bacterium]MDQ3681014.1 YggS family pyridoxal phosphate-dependent enzyme [Actinomycetota bacterium]